MIHQGWAGTPPAAVVAGARWKMPRGSGERPDRNSLGAVVSTAGAIVAAPAAGRVLHARPAAPEARFPAAVLHVPGLPQPQPQPRPRIVLSMIVRDESRVIRRCIQSVRPWIDGWAIVDTGSTDRTREIIRDAMRGVPGELREEPWTDFATARNQALDLAREIGGPRSYAMLPDADMMLHIPPGLRLPPLDRERYGVIARVRAGGFQPRMLLALNDGRARWRRAIHERLIIDGEPDPDCLLWTDPGLLLDVCQDGGTFATRVAVVAKHARYIEAIRAQVAAGDVDPTWLADAAGTLIDAARLGPPDFDAAGCIVGALALLHDAKHRGGAPPKVDALLEMLEP